MLGTCRLALMVEWDIVKCADSSLDEDARAVKKLSWKDVDYFPHHATVRKK